MLAGMTYRDEETEAYTGKAWPHSFGLGGSQVPATAKTQILAQLPPHHKIPCNGILTAWDYHRSRFLDLSLHPQLLCKSQLEKFDVYCVGAIASGVEVQCQGFVVGGETQVVFGEDLLGLGITNMLL